MPNWKYNKFKKFLRSWASDIKFGQTHFLRVDRFGDIWLTDRGDMQAFKFTPEGKLLLTIGKKGVKGDNNSQDTFNGMADVAIAKNGEIREYVMSHYLLLYARFNNFRFGTFGLADPVKAAVFAEVIDNTSPLL